MVELPFRYNLFNRAIFLLLLPTFFTIGGWIAYDHYFPIKPFVFSTPTPTPASTYDRKDVVKQLYLSKGEAWVIGCEKALLTAPKKGEGEWSEEWLGVKGGWETKGIHRNFSANQALYYFSSKSLVAQNILLEEDQKFHLVADKGEVILQQGNPICRLEGHVVGSGEMDEETFQFTTPALLYQGGKMVSFGGHSIETGAGHFEGVGSLEIFKNGSMVFNQKEGGVFVNKEGWSFPFEGELTFDGQSLEIKEGNIKREADCFSFEGHSLKALMKEGKFADVTLGKGVTLFHRLTKGSEPIQKGEAETLDLHLASKEGLLSGKGEERAYFVDRTHGIEMEVDALFFRWNDQGEIEGVEGRGEMTISTQKGAKMTEEKQIQLKVDGLVKRFGSRLVVDTLSFEVKQGEVVALLGPNGAGKTTAFYMTIGLIRPDSGQVIFSGRDVTNLPIHERALLGMGYLAQEPSIFPTLTVEENILLVLESLSLSKKERKKRLAEHLEELHLTSLAKKKAATLSGGERRRLEITRSLVTRPTFLLLDEPFANIDPKSIADVKALISHLSKRGLSVLITDHNAREILSCVDRSYIVEGGRVLLSGTPAELVANPIARRAYLGEDFTL